MLERSWSKSPFTYWHAFRLDLYHNNSNDLALLTLPHSRIVGPQLNIMEKAIADLDAVLSKLVRKNKTMYFMQELIVVIHSKGNFVD